MKTEHELKTHPKYLQRVASGQKPFEIRKNDRDFQVGDRVILKEYDPEVGWPDHGDYSIVVADIIYITDFAKSVRFYVRGNEFTSQLDYFIDCIKKKRTENISSFAEALKTDIIMEKITKDAARSLAEEGSGPSASPVLAKGTKRPSLWRRIFK